MKIEFWDEGKTEMWKQGENQEKGVDEWGEWDYQKLRSICRAGEFVFGWQSQLEKNV